ncbi:MAG: hypothetical protein ABIC82_00845 [bacterium]
MKIKKIKLGIIFGIIAGIIDVIPMILQKLTWDANLSALAHWVIIGFVISVSNIKLKGALKGLAVSIILLIPIAFLAWWNDTSSIIPMTFSTIILGSLLGFLIDKYGE